MAELPATDFGGKVVIALNDNKLAFEFAGERIPEGVT